MGLHPPTDDWWLFVGDNNTSDVIPIPTNRIITETGDDIITEDGNKIVTES